MNTYQIMTRGDEVSEAIATRVHQQLQTNGWQQTETPAVVLAIGGDGTMLHAFQRYYHEEATFLGVHTGTLGFYADWHVDEVDELIQHLLHSERTYVSYPLVHIEVENHEGETMDMLALNELVVKSKTLSTFVMDVHVNNHLFETFRGDGLLVSTPTGSTAYNHAVGGSVLHPSIEAIQVAELAAINNKAFRTLGRSFVLPKHHTLDLYVKNPAKDVLIGVDVTEIQLENVRRIRTTVAEQKIRFMRYRPFPFWLRVKDKFIDG